VKMGGGFKNTLKFVLGLLILAVLLDRIGFGDVGATLRTVEPAVVLLAGFLALLIALLGGINLFILLRHVKRDVKAGEVVKFNLMSISAGTFLPLRAGDFLMVYLLKKSGVKLAHASAVVLIDKFVTVAVLVLFSLPALALVGSLDGAASIIYAAAALLLLTAAARKTLKVFTRKIVKALKDYSAGAFQTLTLNFLISVAKFILSAYIIYLLFAGLGVEVGFTQLAALHALATLTTLIPLTANGLGVKQSVAVLLFERLGVGLAATASAYIILLAVNYALSAAVALYFMKEWRGVK